MTEPALFQELVGVSRDWSDVPADWRDALWDGYGHLAEGGMWDWKFEEFDYDTQMKIVNFYISMRDFQEGRE